MESVVRRIRRICERNASWTRKNGHGTCIKISGGTTEALVQQGLAPAHLKPGKGASGRP